MSLKTELKNLLNDDYCISLDKKRKNEDRKYISISAYVNEDNPDFHWVVYIEDENQKAERKLFSKVYDAIGFFIEYCGENSVEKAISKKK